MSRRSYSASENAQEQVSEVLFTLGQHVHWLIRLAFAGIFMFHGLTKFLSLGQAASAMDIAVPIIAVVAIMEVAAGVLVLVGGFKVRGVTRIAGLLAVPVMIGAIANFHWGKWGFAPSATHPIGGMEFQTLVAALGLYLFLRGDSL